VLAIDTNVVVRFLINDHRVQSAKARDLIKRSEIFVPTTVLLESECVLRSVYGLSGQQIAAALRAFAGLPTVILEDPALAAFGFECEERGMDFADALHLGRAKDCEAFVSFDRRLQSAARAQGLENVRSP